MELRDGTFDFLEHYKGVPAPAKQRACFRGEGRALAGGIVLLGVESATRTTGQPAYPEKLFVINPIPLTGHYRGPCENRVSAPRRPRSAFA